MDWPKTYKLEKFRILVQKQIGKPQEDRVAYRTVDIIELPFNPNSYSRQFGNKFHYQKSQDTNKAPANLSEREQDRISVEFIIDGTGVTDGEMKSFSLKGARKVAWEVKRLTLLCLEKESESHHPNFLILQWGELKNFGCYLETLNVTYTLFDQTGNPLRARLNATFVESVIPGKEDRKNEMNSADITRVHEVKQEDTLLQLTKDVYGSYELMKEVARNNDLDQFRKLEPGVTLVFEPLKKRNNV